MNYLTEVNSISKMSFEFGGIAGGAPLDPYLHENKDTPITTSPNNTPHHSPLVGRNSKLSFATNSHPCQSFIPTFHHLPFAQIKHKGTLSRNIGIKYLVVMGQPSSVLHKHLDTLAINLLLS